MSKLTIEDIKNRVFQNSLQTCIYLDGYKNSLSQIKVKCLKHDYEFFTNWENVRRNNRAHYICPICIEEAREERYSDTKVLIECAYCHKTFSKSKSRLVSKSGLYFCCRQHKDLAQRLNSGNKFNSLRPNHYGVSGTTNYRKNALSNYPNECAICGWKDDVDVLEVHHIDENRQNNELENLIVLCPICHKKLTTHNYKLINRSQIIKI